MGDTVWTIITVAAVAFVALAGCAGDADPTLVVTEGTDGDGMADVAADALTADDEVGAPEWQVGDWFGHHIFFGSDDQAGSHVNTVVVGDEGGSWLLATDDPEVARWEAAFDFPMLGSIDKAGLSASAFTGTWDLYDFPLRDGKTWSTSFNPLFEGERQLSMVATFNPAIMTPYGVKPGFDVVGTNADGQVELRTDYVPAIGWYNRLEYYAMGTEDPDDVALRVISMGVGSDWTGTYFLYDAAQLVADESFGSLADPAYAPAAAYHETFTMAAGQKLLFVFKFTITATGTTDIRLVDPAGGMHELGAQHVPQDPTSQEEAAFTFEIYDMPAMEGDWEYSRLGAAMFSGSVVWLWQMKENQLIL